MNERRRREIVRAIQAHLERVPGFRLACGCVVIDDDLIVNAGEDCELGGSKHPLHPLLAEEARRYWARLEVRVRGTREEVQR